MSGTTITHNVAVDYTGSRSIGGISVGQIIGPVTYQNSVAPEDSLRAQQKRKVEILNWLSPLDFSTRQNEIFQAWQPGTCEWLLETKEFKKWASRRDDCSRRLWCYGKRKSPQFKITVLHSHVSSWCWKDYSCVSMIYLSAMRSDRLVTCKLNMG